VIGANSFVPYNKKFPPKSLITGVPAKVIRELADEETAVNDITPQLYEETIANYQKGNIVGYDKG